MPEDRFLVLYAALFLEWKGHLELLEAMERGATKLAPDVLILLAGAGPLEARIRQRITLLGLEGSFRFVGFQRPLAPFYEVADLVLLPSKAEGFPYVPLEAMAFAKPILATAVGGVPEVVRHGYNGELIAPDRLAEIVPRLNYFSQHREEAARLGRSGRARVEQGFTLESMVANTSRVYERLLSDAPPAP
ncbi:MAG TPA: glycosyltransferase [Gemmatimonadales bacterium]|nr:glycosyltransferase [Gemmatimonadales bacterium]